MARPSGKPKRFRTSEPAFQHESEAPEEPEGEDAAAPATTCSRCGLTFLGDVVVLGVDVGRSMQKHSICEPCYQSLTRWMTRSVKEGGVPGRRRGRSTDIVDTLHSKRRARDHRGIERNTPTSNRKMILSVALSLSAVAGLVLLVAAMLYMTSGGDVLRKAGKTDAAPARPGP